MKKLVLVCVFLIPVLSFAQQAEGSNEQIENLVTEFKRCINEKDSQGFAKLFFSDEASFTGIMSEATEASIKKNYAEFEGVSVSNSKQFILALSKSNQDQRENVYNLKYSTDGIIASVEFDYSFFVGEKMIQWGHESWNLVFVDDSWLITDVIFSIHFPKVEECTFCK